MYEPLFIPHLNTMKIDFISETGASRLLLIFAGWGMDANPFRDLSRAGYDIAVVYDYRTLDLPEQTTLSSYDEICIIAWSFGVASAALFLDAHQQLPVTACVAVNGTLFPVDDNKGIPHAIFDATLRSLSPDSLKRFYRRMCGAAAAVRQFEQKAPQRSFEELADELRAIASRRVPTEMSMWDTVYISDNDLIIPTENQLNAWSGVHDVCRFAGSHLPDFNSIITERFVDKRLVARRFVKANHTYNLSACVQAEIAAQLVDAIEKSAPEGDSFNRILEIGAGTGLLTLPLTERFHPRSLELWDIAAINPALPGHHRICDAETAIKGAEASSLDMIVSASTLQWFNSPADFIRQANRTLRNGGMLAFSTFAPGNFIEIAPFLPASLHYTEAGRLNAILSEAGFEKINIDRQNKTLTFESAIELLRHIRQTGVNALPPSPAAAKKIITAGITSLTYSPLIITAIKSQQQ